MARDDDGAQPIFDGQGREYARQVARALALGVEQDRRYTSNLEQEARWMAYDIGVALLAMNPPRRLSLGERRRLAEAALLEGGWSEEQPEEQSPREPEAPPLRVQPTHTLHVSAHAPGYYAIDGPTGRPLVQGDFIELDIGAGQWVPAVVRKIGGTHHVSVEGKPPIPLAAGQRIRLRETALTDTAEKG